MKREQVASDKAEFLGFFENQSPEWYEIRKGRIGGSQIGAALGLSPWESPITCYYKVRGEIPDTEASTAMRLGTLLEDPLLELFQQENPTFEVFKSGSYTSKDYKWLLANPDAFYRDDKGVLHLIEVKTTSDFWESASDIPPNYIAQVQSYLWLFQIPHAKVVALCGGRYKTFDVEYDQFLAESNLAALRRFWDHVEAGSQPMWDGSDSTYETMRRLNPEINPDDVEELGDLGMYLALAKDELDVAKEKYQELQSRTLDALGSAKWGAINDEIVLYRTQRGSGAPFISWKKGK